MPLSPTKSSTLLIAALVAVLTGNVTAAPPKANGTTQKAQEEVKAAATVLQADLKQLTEAQRAQAQAQAAVKAAVKGEADAKLKAQATHERSVGLEKLLAEQKAAKKDFKESSEPVLEVLRKSDAYSQAKKKAEAAKSRLPTLKASSSAAADAAFESNAVAHLESETIEKDAQLKPLKDRVTLADKAATEARAKIHKLTASDGGVQTAQVELEKSKADLKQANQHVGQMLQKAGYDQALVNKEQQEAQMLQLMDRMKSQKGKGKGKK